MEYKVWKWAAGEKEVVNPLVPPNSSFWYKSKFEEWEANVGFPRIPRVRASIRMNLRLPASLGSWDPFGTRSLDLVQGLSSMHTIFRHPKGIMRNLDHHHHLIVASVPLTSPSSLNTTKASPFHFSNTLVCPPSSPTLTTGGGGSRYRLETLGNPGGCNTSMAFLSTYP